MVGARAACTPGSKLVQAELRPPRSRRGRHARVKTMSARGRPIVDALRSPTIFCIKRPRSSAWQQLGQSRLLTPYGSALPAHRRAAFPSRAAEHGACREVGRGATAASAGTRCRRCPRCCGLPGPCLQFGRVAQRLAAPSVSGVEGPWRGGTASVERRPRKAARTFASTLHRSVIHRCTASPYAGASSWAAAGVATTTSGSS